MAKRKQPRPKAPRRKSDAPLVLYAVEGHEHTWFGERSFDSFEDGVKVAVYDLREVRVMHVSRGLR